MYFRRYAMCGIDDHDIVSESILSKSCTNAYNKCGPSVDCMRDYIRDAFEDRLYRFCPNRMNLIVTPQYMAWHGWIKYAQAGGYYCAAYCVAP